MSTRAEGPFWRNLYGLGDLSYVYYGDKTINASIGAVCRTEKDDTRGKFRAHIDLLRKGDSLRMIEFFDDKDKAKKWVELLVKLNL